MDLDDLSLGVFIGLLVGEGHFGGDGKQPQVTLRMHTRHETLFRWLTQTFPGGRLYGPYAHGGRSYFQWMARGTYLREVILPAIAPHIAALDAHVWDRVQEMAKRYRIELQVPPEAPEELVSPSRAT